MYWSPVELDRDQSSQYCSLGAPQKSATQKIEEKKLERNKKTPSVIIARQSYTCWWQAMWQAMLSSMLCNLDIWYGC